MIPLDRINSVDINVKREVDKFAFYEGPRVLPGTALPDVYRAYRNLKKLQFFGRVCEQFHNTEEHVQADGRTYDIFQADPGRGRIFIITEASEEAVNEFDDDGYILLKLREWLGESLRRVVSPDPKLPSPLEKWDRRLYGKGTMLPGDVRAIPFFSPDFVPGIPALMIILVKPQ